MISAFARENGKLPYIPAKFCDLVAHRDLSSAVTTEERYPSGEERSTRNSIQILVGYLAGGETRGGEIINE